jgi:hypothetical protein
VVYEHLHKPMPEPVWSVAAHPGGHIGLVAVGVSQRPPRGRVLVADEVAAGGDRRRDACLGLVVRHGSWPAASASFPIASASATPAVNDPVRKCAHAPPNSTRQSPTPSASWNCRGVIRSAMGSTLMLQHANVGSGQGGPPAVVAAVETRLAVGQQRGQRPGLGSEPFPGLAGEPVERGGFNSPLDRTPHPGDVAVDEQCRQHVPFGRATSFRYSGGMTRLRPA